MNPPLAKGGPDASGGGEGWGFAVLGRWDLAETALEDSETAFGGYARRLHSDTALGDCNRRLCSETRRLHLETALGDSETALGGYARRLRLEHAEHAEDF